MLSGRLRQVYIDSQIVPFIPGLFIRRMILAFEKLTFSQVTELHSKFQRYYEAANIHNNFEDSQEFGGSLLDSAMSLSGVRFSKSGLGRSYDPFQSIAEG